MRKFVIVICVLNVILGYTQENPPNPTDDKNWISNASYDLNGNTISKGIGYFNTLGKGTQKQSWDVLTDSIWASQTLYDYQGRPAFQTLSAPIGSNFGYQNNFIQKSGGATYTTADFESNSENPAPIYHAENSLGWYYSNNNNHEIYQDITSYPFSRTIYSKLNPGTVKAVLGGNKTDTNNDGVINSVDTWLQTYSFSMPASQELATLAAFGSRSYNNKRISKTINRDVHGVETVVFTDSDGNTLAAARCGNEEGLNTASELNVLTIGKQGWVDIHVPQGVSKTITLASSNSSVSTLISSIDREVVFGSSALTLPRGIYFRIYNLMDESKVTEIVPGSYTLPNHGFYRIELRWGYFRKGRFGLSDRHYSYSVSGNPEAFNMNSERYTVSHYQNYYDYSLNYYDKAGRLLKSTQPQGKHLQSTFKYNTLGQLLETTSPDEGAAKFKYRKDGQIRFSQNSKQALAGEFSYTNYDQYARPIESGVLENTAFETANPETDELPTGTRKEQHITTYDTPDSVGLEALRASGLLSYRYGNQQFVEGNVSKTTTNNPKTNTTWHSYDVYGRVTWLIQNVEGLGVKTIDYEYDFATGQVTRVIYQKFNTTEYFAHRYAYNNAGQLTLVETSDNTNTYSKQAEYFYYETGALKRTEIADGIQGTDYVYNLSGQLKSINHPALSASKDPGGDTNDLFGMQLDYYQGDYARTNRTNITTSALGTNQYNGNIKNTRWNTSGNLPSPREHVYSYNYNKNNWLTEANFNATENIPSGVQPDVISTDIVLPGTTLNLEASNSITLQPNFHAQLGSTFTAKIVEGDLIIPEGDYDVNNITYDANGNIKTLKRNGYTGGGTNAMDDFTYNYNNNGNQLNSITDANDNANPDRYNDLKSQGPTETVNYIYNNIGQLEVNIQDQIQYEYNASGLVTKINSFVNNNTGIWATLYKSKTKLGDWSSWIFSGASPLELPTVKLAFIYEMGFTNDPFIIPELEKQEQELRLLNEELQANSIETIIPIDPDSPISPINPSDPTEPIDPDNPTDPTDPIDPGDPGDPIVPKFPINCLSLSETYGLSTALNMKNATAKLTLNTAINKLHKLDLDAIIRHTINKDGDITEAAGAIITIKDAHGTTLVTVAYNSPNPTIITDPDLVGICDPFFTRHASLEFTPTTNTITLEVQRDCSSTGNIYIDNLHLQVAASAKLAFFYDDKGKRVSKQQHGEAYNQTTYYVRDASGNPMAIYNAPIGKGATIGRIEYAIYGSNRLGVRKARVDYGKKGNPIIANTYSYQLTDHLGNVRAVILKNGTDAISLTSKTDYYPFGMPMPNRNIEGNYRYKYQGQEKDPETGKEAFELRLWDSRIGRWLTTDPMNEFSSPYLGMGNNPISTIDPDGGQTCRCKTGVGRFLNKVGSSIGGFFKNNFGRYRPARQGTRRYTKIMGRGSSTIYGNKRKGREKISPIKLIQMQELIRTNIDITASLITPTTIRNISKPSEIDTPDGRRVTVTGVQSFPTRMVNLSGRLNNSITGVTSGTLVASIDVTSREVQTMINNLRNNPCLSVRIDFTSSVSFANPTAALVRQLNNNAVNVHQRLSRFASQNGIDPNRIQRGWIVGRATRRITYINNCNN